MNLYGRSCATVQGKKSGSRHSFGLDEGDYKVGYNCFIVALFNEFIIFNIVFRGGVPRGINLPAHPPKACEWWTRREINSLVSTN